MALSTAILLYSATHLPRWQYSASYLLSDLLAFSVHFTTDRAAFEHFTGPKICYHPTRLDPGGLHLIPHRLLAESDIRDQALATSLFEGVPTLCEVPPGGTLPFDAFAATFYVLSRYEEYSPYAADEHDRFPAAVSWASRANCLGQPIIWEWAMLLWKALQQQYPRLVRPRRNYHFQPTYDVDLPWAFRHRGLRGVVRGLLGLVGGQWAVSRQRLSVWLGQQADPFFTFPYLRELHQRTNTRARIFWLVAAKRSRYDINPNTQLPAYRSLITETCQWAECGLHPSYASYHTPTLLRQERQELRAISGQSITHSRQHFLRLRLPCTYQQLIAAGIRHDYSMGFADAIGYRAGTSEAFYWFDLEKNEVTDLLIHPFVAMDVTLRKYLQLSPTEASTQLQALQSYCRSHGLTFTTLWHNSSFAPGHGWAGWSEAYEGLFT